MNLIDEFNLWLMAWAAGFGLVLWGQRKQPQGGLVLAYALQMWVIHWLAPSIYALPWYSAPNNALVAGLRESTVAIVGFAVGSSAIAPWLFARSRTITALIVNDQDQATDPWLTRRFLLIGTLGYFLTGATRGIATVGALVSVSANLLLVACALECWNTTYGTRASSIWRWVALSALLPFVSIVTSGFLSYGFAAMLAVFAFVASIFRPRWKLVGWALVASYLTLSIYVTYMRDRSEIRAVVWGEEALGARVTRVAQTFANFEFLNPGNIDHLHRIDDRLNQTSLVGYAVINMAGKRDPFAHGETIRDALMSPIPRFLWLDKPISAGSGDLVSRFTGITFGEGTSVGIGHVMEWYVNFGTIGIFFGFLGTGLLIAWADRSAIASLQRGDSAKFAVWYFPTLSMLQVGGSLVEAVSGAVAAYLIVAFICRLRPAHLRGAVPGVTSSGWTRHPAVPAAAQDARRLTPIRRQT